MTPGVATPGFVGSRNGERTAAAARADSEHTGTVSPASKVTLPLPGYVSVCQHYITEYCIEKRDPITWKRII